MRQLLLYFDLESTGLSAYLEDMTEIAFSLSLYDSNATPPIITLPPLFSSLIQNKRRPLTAEIIGVTGITPEHLKSAPSPEKAMVQILVWLQTHITAQGFGKQQDDEVILIAHNGNSFDFTLLFQTLERVGFSAIHALQNCGITHVSDSFYWFKSQKIVTTAEGESLLCKTKTGQTCYKLGELYSSFFPNESFMAHGALSDTLALARMMNTWLLQRVPSAVVDNDDGDKDYHQKKNFLTVAAIAHHHPRKTWLDQSKTTLKEAYALFTKRRLENSIKNHYAIDKPLYVDVTAYFQKKQTVFDPLIQSREVDTSVFKSAVKFITNSYDAAVPISSSPLLPTKTLEPLPPPTLPPPPIERESRKRKRDVVVTPTTTTTTTSLFCVTCQTFYSSFFVTERDLHATHTLASITIMG